MTDKEDSKSGSNSLPTGQSDTGDVGDPCDTGSVPTREEWEELSSDPDMEDDLGYRFAEWEEYSTVDGSETLMYLPGDESLLRDDAYVVAPEEAVKDLGEWY